MQADIPVDIPISSKETGQSLISIDVLVDMPEVLKEVVQSLDSIEKKVPADMPVDTPDMLAVLWLGKVQSLDSIKQQGRHIVK